MGVDPDAQQAVINTAIIAGVIVPVLFVIQYTYIARWWRNSTGRLLVALDILICLARLPRAAELLSHHPAQVPKDWLTIAADIGIPLVIMCRMAAFEHQRRRHQRRELQYARLVALGVQ